MTSALRARTYADAHQRVLTALLDVLLPGGLFMSVVDVFKYLGSYISRGGSDAPDVDARITSAGKAFGALSSCLFRSTDVSQEAKREVYAGEILSILLYGAEHWLITARILHRLRCFHAQCLRVMCGVKKARMIREHISTHGLAQEMGLDSIDNYVYRRQLRWLGHVYRMGFERTPRRMLTAWLPMPRPQRRRAGSS